MFFDGWQPILRVLVVGTLGYVALIALLRVSGKRTLSKMNAFDFVITITLGSAFATLLLSSEVALATGVTALALLIGLQFAVTFWSVRSPSFQRLVKARPTLLYHRGQFLDDAMRGARVAREEVWAVIREQGSSSLDRVQAVVLETDSSISILAGGGDEPITTLQTVDPGGRDTAPGPDWG